MIRYPNSPSANYYALAIEDGLKRLVIPSVERSIRCQLSEKAQQQSMDIFSMNLEKLLLQAPMKNKIIMGFDPAFRTGCKLAIINEQGRNLHVDVIYPHPPKPKKLEAEKTLVSLCQQYHVNIIAIGNGTASRESEAFVAQTIQKYGLDVAYTIVSEAGASVYSASSLRLKNSQICMSNNVVPFPLRDAYLILYPNWLKLIRNPLALVNTNTICHKNN